MSVEAHGLHQHGTQIRGERLGRLRLVRDGENLIDGGFEAALGLLGSGKGSWTMKTDARSGRRVRGLTE